MQAGGLNMSKFIVPFSISQTHLKTGTNDFKYQSKIYIINNESCMLVKARSGNCGM
jgi:hypothetical protein